MTESIWKNFAERFKYDTSPGRPCSEDIEFVSRQLLSLKKPTHGILLGVTRELAELANDGINITAVDKSPEMIEHQWIGNNSNRTVKQGDWLDLPSMFTKADFILGDGVFSALDRNSSHRLMDCVRNVLADDGIFIVRLFCSPKVRESIEDIYASTTNNFVAFRWRLAQSLCDANYEVRVKDILSKYKEVVGPKEIARFGWTEAQLSTIDVYENLPYILSFITEPLFEELCQQHNMQVVDKFYGSYELSELCPTFVLRKA